MSPCVSVGPSSITSTRLPAIESGSSTVTRLFADFKKKQLLQVKGSTVIIKNRVGLESVVSS